MTHKRSKLIMISKSKHSIFLVYFCLAQTIYINLGIQKNSINIINFHFGVGHSTSESCPDEDMSYSKNYINHRVNNTYKETNLFCQPARRRIEKDANKLKMSKEVVLT